MTSPIPERTRRLWLQRLVDVSRTETVLSVSFILSTSCGNDLFIISSLITNVYRYELLKLIELQLSLDYTHDRRYHLPIMGDV